MSIDLIVLDGKHTWLPNSEQTSLSITASLKVLYREVVGLDRNSILRTLLHANQLKRTARTGWVQRGVPGAENVAAHSYGVSFATLILAPTRGEPIELGKALAMAILHDLPEGLTSDIPSPAWRFLPENSKNAAERSAMNEIVDDLDQATGLLEIWEEFREAATAEARLVHDADKIDLYLQALIYEQQSGNEHLQEFWVTEPSFYFSQSRSLYEAMRDRRRAGNKIT